MAILQTKYIQVGSYYNSRGYYYSGYINYGTVSNSSGGTSGQWELGSVYSGSKLYTISTGYNTTRLQLDIHDGSSNVTNGVWDKIVLAGTTFNRTDATYTQNYGTNVDRWVWTISSDPFSSNGTWDTLTFETTASDTTPENLSFANVTVAANSEQNILDIVTTIDTSINVTMSGDGTFACVGTSTTPSSSNFNTNAKTITNGQYIHLKVTAGPNAGDTRTITITAGTVTTTWTVTTETPAIVAPTVSSSFTNSNASSPNVIIGVNLSANGSGGTLKYAQTTSNSVPASGWQTANGFTHPRGTTRYYWASRDEDTSGTYGSSVALAVGYRAPDTSVTPSDVTIPFNATSATTVISNLTFGETYQVRNNAGTTTYDTVAYTTSGTSSINATVSSDLPSGGSATVFKVYAQRPTSMGGDNLYDDTGDTFAITRLAADTTPNAFTIPDKTGDPNSVQTSFTQITGITAAATIAVSSTTATWAVSSSASVPASSAFGTSANSITNDQYLHVKQTASSSYSTTLSTVFTVGGVADTFSTITNAQPGSETGTGGYGFQQLDSNGHLIVDSTSSVKTFITYTQGLVVTLYPPNLGNTSTYPNTQDVTVPDLTSQQDFEDNYVVTRTDGGVFNIFGNETHTMAYQATNTIRFTWAGTCTGLFGNVRTCAALDLHANTFDISIIGKTL